MQKIVWVPTVIWDRCCFVYFDQIDQKLKGEFERIINIPLYFKDREEAEAFLLAYKISDHDGYSDLDISKTELIREGEEIIDYKILEYTNEEILKYYGPDYL